MSNLSEVLQLQSKDAAPIKPRVAVARGDGIGPEIMDASLRVLEAAGAEIDPVTVELGESVYRAGHSAGIAPETWELLRSARALLKAPITTPSGGGVKSLNVTLRKALGLYANVRPVRSYEPFVVATRPGIDLVIVRENEEDLYAGVEHRQTDDMVQCLKLISRPGCERIVRYAFEYARAHGRRKVSCMSKDNIMKLSDGLFHRVFDELAADYPEIATDHHIIDIGAARLAVHPERFDVIVTSNLYGDIISDVAAEVAGSVGLAASANLGEHAALFEAIHGSAPDIAGCDRANPSGLLLAAAQMLAHLGQGAVATRIHNAWLATVEAGVHTADMAGPNTLRTCGTQGLADAVIARLGESPRRLSPVKLGSTPIRAWQPKPVVPALKTLVGVDVFVHAREVSPDQLAARVSVALPPGVTLQMISNRGTKVWPQGQPETFCVDHWRCRLMGAGGFDHARLAAVLVSLAGQGIDFIKTENLCEFDGVPGYSLGQGQ